MVADSGGMGYWGFAHLNFKLGYECMASFFNRLGISFYRFSLLHSSVPPPLFPDFEKLRHPTSLCTRFMTAIRKTTNLLFD